MSQGIKAMAMTDINNTSCAFQFIQACEKNGVKPILGIEYWAGHKLLYIGIARNVNGWAGLCRLLSEASIDDIDLPACAPEIPEYLFYIQDLSKEITTFRADEFYGIRPDEINTLHTSPLRKHMDRLVAFAPITFTDEDGWKVHKLLRCIDLNRRTERPGRELGRSLREGIRRRRIRRVRGRRRPGQDPSHLLDQDRSAGRPGGRSP